MVRFLNDAVVGRSGSKFLKRRKQQVFDSPGQSCDTPDAYEAQLPDDLAKEGAERRSLAARIA